MNVKILDCLIKVLFIKSNIMLHRYSTSRMSLSYREFIECRYIGLFRISKSISYRTSHIEYLDILKTNDFFVFFRRKFQKFSENSENSPKIQKTHEPKSSTTTTAPKIPKIRRKFWKFAENSSKRRSSLRPSYRIVSRKKPSYHIDIVSSRKKAYRSSLIAIISSDLKALVHNG